MLEISHLNGGPLKPEEWSVSMAIDGKVASNVERRIRRRDTGAEWIGSFSFAPIHDAGGAIAGTVVVVRDVTKEKRIIEELEASNERYRAAFDVSHNGMIVTRVKDGMIQEYNDRLTEMLGYTRDEIVGKTTVELGVWSNTKERREVVEMLRDSSPCVDINMELKSKTGQQILTSIAITKFRSQGEECLLSDVHDLTKSKHDEEEIRKLGTLAYYDPLTGLFNRRMFIERLEHCIERNERKNQINGLIYMDLNHFKDLNDRLGHLNGDHVLCDYATRLKRAVRKGDTVARIGGDEFVILLENLGTSMKQALDAIGRVETKIAKLSEEPMHLANENLKCTSCMGVKVFQGSEMPAEQLVEAADLDMYKRKTEER
jgi:diguanylate cyclase (GGDEF)-like protein/PAS domain S-box-containing protein